MAYSPACAPDKSESRMPVDHRTRISKSFVDFIFQVGREPMATTTRLSTCSSPTQVVNVHALLASPSLIRVFCHWHCRPGCLPAVTRIDHRDHRRSTPGSRRVPIPLDTRGGHLARCPTVCPVFALGTYQHTANEATQSKINRQCLCEGSNLDVVRSV